MLMVVGVYTNVNAQANPWATSPFNWDNSPYNFQNSPNNWNNSQYNWQAPNAIYDNQGNRQGYVVPNGSGTYNYFDNQGNRRGYSR